MVNKSIAMIIVGGQQRSGRGTKEGRKKKLEKENSEVRKRNRYTKNLGKHST